MARIASPIFAPFVRIVAAVARVPGPAEVAVAATNVLLNWTDRARQRHQLAQMDDRMLRDVGLSKTDVTRETAKLPWQS